MTAPAGVSISPPLRRIKDCDDDITDALEEYDEQMMAAEAATDSP